MRMRHGTSGRRAVHLLECDPCSKQLLTAGRSVKLSQYLFESHEPMLTLF